MNNPRISDNYYDTINNTIAVRGFDYCTPDNAKYLMYPDILSGLYTISKSGKVYSMMNDCYLSWNIIRGYPSVNLIKTSRQGTTLEPFYIKDLMAYNFIAEAKSYLERGWKVINIDGDVMNCAYSNIRYIDPMVVKN